MDFELEICCNSLNSALAAQKGRASRIELCDNMAEGGTTPSTGLIEACRNYLTIPVFPMIRPRGGDFLYKDAEFEMMKRDISVCKNLNCEGVVIGMLKTDGSINVERCAELVAIARPMQITFHRAFDRCNNLEEGLSDIISLGCERVLTSGAEVSAANAISTLSNLVTWASGRIIIMAGSGINESNIADIAFKTGVRAFHSTAKSSRETQMTYLGTGKLAELDGRFPILEADPEKVRKMRAALAGVPAEK